MRLTSTTRQTYSIKPSSLGCGFAELWNPNFGKRDTGYFQVGAYVEHVPTGVFGYGAYGREECR